MKIISLYYHDPIISGFEKMIKYWQKRGYRFISIDEMRDIMLSKKEIKEKIAFITLDDGWKQNLELLPIIEKYNVPICIFISIQPVIDGNFWWEYVGKVYDKQGVNEFKLLPYEEFYKQLNTIKEKVTLTRSAMTIEEVKQISKHPLVSLQAHTVNHPILTSVPDDVLEMELKDGKEILEDLIDKKVYAFSYCNGRNTERESGMARKYYDIAFTTVQNNIQITDDIMLLPRFSLTGQWPRDLLKVKGIWWKIKHLAQSIGLKKKKTIYD
ncbi:MAG: polysaccharide deacetylase family protein [Bacteroidaceae bacterium]|nr:polysaccharide deacetylase family protein [Bacteroidaceae bacterium]